MCLMVDRYQPIDADVGVELGSRQRGMAEHLLHAAQVSPALKQVGGRCVPQAVRPGVGHRVSRRDPVVNDPADCARADPAGSGAEEESVAGRSTGLPGSAGLSTGNPGSAGLSTGNPGSAGLSTGNPGSAGLSQDYGSTLVKP